MSVQLNNISSILSLMTSPCFVWLDSTRPGFLLAEKIFILLYSIFFWFPNTCDTVSNMDTSCPTYRNYILHRIHSWIRILMSFLLNNMHHSSRIMKASHQGDSCKYGIGVFKNRCYYYCCCCFRNNISLVLPFILEMIM